MKRTLLLWLMALPFMWMTAQTGTITVSGTVVDQSGQAIPNFPILTGVLPIFANPTVVTTDALGAYTVTLQVDTVVGTPVFFAYNNCIDPQHSDVYVLAADTTLSFNGCVGTGGGSCSAAFSGNAQSLSSLTVDFQAFFTGYNRYEWIFGDGNTDLGTNSNVTHTYAAAGTYTILLTIEDTANACVDTVAQTITLLGTGGGCNAQFSTFPSGPGSYNFFPVVNDPSLAYFWDFDDGNTSTQSTPIHTYSSNGTYNVCLIISDFTAGCSDTFCISLTVGITPPCNINFYAFQSQNNNLQANFFPNDTSFATYAWDFGDGNTSSAVHPVHTYAALGTYNVCLTVSDGANCTVTQCDSVRIDTIPTGACDASFGYSQGFWPLSVDFALLNQSGPAGFILTTWDYGDGTVTQSGPYSNHTYAQAGTYTVCAVVIDPFYNCTDSFCQTVTVTNQGGNNCSAFFFQSYDFTDPNNVHFCVIDSTYATYSWDFGDGGSSTMPNPSHRYSSNGNYTACLAIDDGNGCVDTFCTQVFIGSFTPCIADFSAVPDTNPLTVNFSAIFPDPAITYSWDFGDGNSATGLNPTHTYASTGSYTVTLSITDSVNCNNSSSQTISTAPIPPTNNLLLGQVLVNGIPATDITVYLIQYDSLAGTLTAIDTFSSNGILGFSGLFFLQAPVGDHLVKASLNASDPDYANYLPTYYGDSLAWTGALTVNAANFPLVLINLQAGTNPGGPGFIGGLISQGAGKNGPGDPMEGMSVMIMDANGQPVTHTLSHQDGTYELSGLAYGTYTVIVEFWGKESQTHTITLSEDNPRATDIDFSVEDDLIEAVSFTTGIETLLDVNQVSLYPNPANTKTALELSLLQAAEMQLEVTDLSGKRMQTISKNLARGTQNVDINTAGLPAGVYLVNIRLNNEFLYTQKLMVSRR